MWRCPYGEQASDGRLWKESKRLGPAFAELEAAKMFADAHRGCCYIREERCSANIDNVQGHGR